MRILRRKMRLIDAGKVQVTYDDGGIYLRNLTQEQEDKLKILLTFKNPVYENTKRYSRYSYTTVNPYLTYYDKTEKGLFVPVGTDIYSEELGLDFTRPKDFRVDDTINFPDFLLNLRATQKAASDEFLTQNRSLRPTGIACLKTGMGKSILGLYLAFTLSARTLIIVHKDDLVRGWNEDIELAFGGKVKPGLIKAKSRRIGKEVTIATVQTLSKLSEKELEVLRNTFSFVVVDESHHIGSNTFNIVGRFNSRYKLGLSATPERSDGLTHVLHLYLGAFCYKQSAEDEQSDILPVTVRAMQSIFYFNPVGYQLEETKYVIRDSLSDKKHYDRNYVLKDNEIFLRDIPYKLRPQIPFTYVDNMISHRSMKTVCAHVLEEYDKGHSCLVFLAQKEHCREYYDYLKDSISEEHLGLYYGDTKDNEDVRKKAEQVRKFVTITTYSKATEGTNVKQWEVAFLVSSLNNGKNVEQAVGRIRRKKEHKISPVIVYDYRHPQVYMVSSHSKTRDKRYQELHFNTPYLKKSSKSMFSRGYKNRH